MRYIVSGRVQGVGFRYYTLQLARKWGIVGWVRNLPDGTVEIEAGGDISHLALFLAAVRRGPPGSAVTGLENLEAPAEEFSSFTIEG